MPTAPLRFCAQPGCAARVEHGYCPAHTRQQERYRGSQRERGYTREWERKAAAFKVRYPLCGMRPNNQLPVLSHCHDEGRITPVFQVDHVIPHKGNAQLMWDEEGNWQSLCASCGSRKSKAGL